MNSLLRPRRHSGCLLVILVSALTLSLPAIEEATTPVTPETDLTVFPNRPIRIIVYTGPGGQIDFTARKFAEIARKYAPEHPFVVINKPGAGGIVAFEEVIQAPADGYNILAVTRSNVTKLVSSGREDLLDQVNWFAYLTDNPHVAITNVNSGLSNWEKVTIDSRARDGRQIWLGVDIGGVKHISGIRLWEQSNLSARWIPYNSGGQAVAALLGEIGQVYFGNPSDAAGNPSLTIVGSCSPHRMKDFPEVPTFAELGVPDLEDELIWRGLAFRKGMPKPILDWYDDLVQKVNADPDWREQWSGEGINATYKGSEEFEAIVAQDRVLFRQILEPLGLLKSKKNGQWLGFLDPETAVRFANGILLLIFIIGSIRLAKSASLQAFGEIFVAAAALLAATSLLIMSSLLPRPNAIDTVGSAGVPLLWAVALLLLAALQIVISLRRCSGKSNATASLLKRLRKDHLLPAFFLGIFIYLALISTVGYHLSTIIFIPAAFWLLGFRRPLPTAVITVLWISFAYFVFQQALYVDLPAGWLTGAFTD
ncbi:MAG: tripartite tricarboxylate transporter substrate-binding protein [Verrucomicrobiales bacterium]|nr:tripartite tricarboxylate transporter substrate-binding protein [Verrucomicrobiales bacterium]